MYCHSIISVTCPNLLPFAAHRDNVRNPSINWRRLDREKHHRASTLNLISNNLSRAAITKKMNFIIQVVSRKI
jgi:hypothetical protein